MNLQFMFKDPFLVWLAGASVQAGVLVVLILAVQGLLRERLAPSWRHALWFLLLLRLVLPWAPESRLSVYNLMESARAAMNPVVKSASLPLMRQASETPTGKDLGAINAPVAHEIPKSAATFPTVAEPLALGATINWLDVLGWIWAAGAALFAGVAVAQSLALGRAIRRQRPVTDQRTLELLEECKDTLGMRAWLAVVEVPGLRSPALFGFVRPCLLLPKGAIGGLSPLELRHVFLHELAHLKRRDIPLSWLLAILQSLHWFNPLVWVAFHRMRCDRELACDALVLSHLNPGEPAEYGRTIVHLLERYALPRRVPAMAGILEDKSEIKRRITMIAKFRNYSWVGTLAAAGLMILIGCATLTNAKTPYVRESFDRPFVSDPAAVGTWQSVDFVKKIEDFKPGNQSWKGDLYLKGMVFMDGGKTSGPWIWTRGYLWHPGDKTEARYEIKNIGGVPYLFMEWISGDVTQRGEAPWYYVLKQQGAAGGADIFGAAPGDSQSGANDVLQGLSKRRAEESLDEARRHLKDVQTRHDAGIASAEELQKADAELRAVNAQLSGDLQKMAQAELENAKQRLDLMRKQQQAGLTTTEDLAKAEAELKIAQAKLSGDYRQMTQVQVDFAKQKYERIQKLQKSGLGSKEELQQAEAELKRAQLALAQMDIVKQQSDQMRQLQQQLQQSAQKTKEDARKVDANLKAVEEQMRAAGRLPGVVIDNQAAQQDYEAARKDYEATRADYAANKIPLENLLRAETRLYAAQAQALGDREALARAKYEGAAKIHEMLKWKVDHGQMPHDEYLKAEAEMKAAEAEVKAAQADYERQKKSGPEARKPIATIRLTPGSTPDSPARIMLNDATIGSLNELNKKITDIRAAKATKAGGVSDVTVEADSSVNHKSLDEVMQSLSKLGCVGRLKIVPKR